MADCSDISITPNDSLAATTFTYSLFDTAHVWSYQLYGNFDVCDGVVSLQVEDFKTKQQAPPAFSVTYSSATTTIEISVDTEDRSYLGNYQLVLSFTAPAAKTLPSSSYLLDVTVVDPCDADIWTDSDFGTLAYTIGDTYVSKANSIVNTLNVDFCEFEIVSV